MRGIAIAERWIASARRECLDRMLTAGERRRLTRHRPAVPDQRRRRPAPSNNIPPAHPPARRHPGPPRPRPGGGGGARRKAARRPQPRRGRGEPRRGGGKVARRKAACRPQPPQRGRAGCFPERIKSEAERRGAPRPPAPPAVTLRDGWGWRMAEAKGWL